MENIEKRVSNLEKALVGVCELIKDNLSPSYAEAVETMMSDFFDSAEKLGGFKDLTKMFDVK